MHLFKNSNNLRCYYARTCVCVYVCLIKFTIRVSNECFYTVLRGQNLIFTSSAFAEHLNLNVNKKNRPCLGRVEAEILMTPRCVYSFPSCRMMQDIDVVLLVVFSVDSSCEFPTTF